MVFVLMPLSIGSIVLATVGGSGFSGNACVIVGYMMMLLTPFIYYGIFFTLRQSSSRAIARWFLLGFRFIAVTLPCFLLVCSVKAYKNLFFIKEASVICFKIGVMPWIIGWWLKVCASPMFRTQKFEFDLLILIMLRWMAGLCCVMHVDAYMELIQKILHKRAFWFLQDVTEPNYKITQLNLGYTLFVFGSHGVLLVIMFYLPFKAITLICPSFFPFELWVTSESLQLVFVSSGIYINLMLHGFYWLIEPAIPAIKLIVHNWIITVSCWLHLSDFLLVVPREENSHRADQDMRPLLPPRNPDDESPLVLLYTIAEGSMVRWHGSQNVEDDIEDQRDNRVMLRIALMLVLAALTIFLLSTAFMALPVLVGRVFFGSIPISFIMQRFGLKRDDFCGFWIGCCIYIGICFAYDHILKGEINFLLDNVLIKIRNGLMISIRISVIPGLLSVLYLLVKSFPLLGFSQTINSTVERFTWPVLLALITIWFTVKLTRDLVIHLHQLVFNERYLVGERVGNLTEDRDH